MAHPQLYACQKFVGEQTYMPQGEDAAPLPQKSGSVDIPLNIPPGPPPSAPKKSSDSETPVYRLGQNCKVGDTATDCDSTQQKTQVEQKPPVKKQAHVQQPQFDPLRPLIAFFTGGQNW
jgi:hypothetical protein